jgi:hypothetical protein
VVTKVRESMGRKKKAESAGDPRMFGIAIRGSREWRDWVNRLADFRRMKATDMVDQALVEYAERHGFEEEAPKR